MTEILSIPVEFDTIQVVQTHLESDSYFPHVVKRDVPRPPLGWFTHHAVQTFAKQCSEGRISLNRQDNRETSKSLTPEELFALRQAADEDKQRYNERVELAGRGGAEELVHLVEQKELQESGFAPSAFKLFKNSPQVRARLLNARTMKGEESLTLDIDPQPPEKSPSRGKKRQRSRTRRARTRPVFHDEEVLVSTDEAEGDDKQKSQVADAKVDPDCWRPTGDDNLTADEKKLFKSIPLNVRQWDRSPRAARNAYTLYYADRLTAEGSPHLGEDPHCPSTSAKIHAAWEAANHDTRQRFENVANIDKQEFDRQEKEWTEWRRAWPDSEHRLLLRKVIDRWHPHSSFGDGQNRPRAAIPPRGRQAAVPAVDYELPCLNYPVIRTDYSNGAIYEHLRHVLLNSSFLGQALDWMELTFYDGLQPPSTPVKGVRSLSVDDPRANDYEWCKTNLENKSLDDLKASFGELSFHWKEHIPVYSFGGKRYAIVIDAQSMQDGTVVFALLDSDILVDTRPDDDCGAWGMGYGAWEQDPNKEWHVAPRMQAADVIIKLVNLDIGKVGWDEIVKHEVDHGLDLLLDPKAQRWRGWQWAVEDAFGEGALESVVGEVESAICIVPFEDEE